EPVAFIDDKRSLQGSNINGIRVHGSDSLPELVRRRKIDRILLAMPTASRRRRREILTQLEPLGVRVQSLPNLSDLISGKAQINELHDVDVGDLLGRDPVPPNPKLFGSSIRGKCVLVTGAGGSIGSELCRQILRLSPSRLVLFEMSELALYRTQRELEELAAHEKLSAELVLQALQERSPQTRFCMVRFGNVLASSGSVVPLFQEQIRRGGPVTVTHRDVIRYFMTIPEAAQLVIQAGSMAQGGDVFVLDMGRPVRIDDLARRLVSLMGLTVRDAQNPEGDIAIEYTGLRPAEKLFEELLIGSNVTGTDHPMIMRAMEHRL